MKPGVSEPPVTQRSGDPRTVLISKWVNETPPAWDQILTARDVARLTRRHRWILSTLVLIGRFPKEQRFRGRPVGWSRKDVDGWLARKQVRSARRRPRVLRPLKFWKAPCSAQLCLFCRSPHVFPGRGRHASSISARRPTRIHRHGR